MRHISRLLVGFLLGCSKLAFASLIIHMKLVDGGMIGKDIGTITADDTIYGLLLTPHLHGLPPGVHGFHVHQFPCCNDHAEAAGGHLDPLDTDKHLGPYRAGHLGDMPILVVDNKGNATLPLLAPRLRLDQIKNRSLIIHASGDNYSDIPNENGGGGARIACGAVPYFN